MTQTLKIWTYKVINPLLAIVVILSGINVVLADQHPFPGDHDKYKMGKKIFSDYCSRCHGENADGRGKIIPLYIKMRAPRPSNFTVKFFSIRPPQYLSKIIRDGGEKHSLSEYMPPFGGELNNDQINNVVYFIQNVSIYTAEYAAKKRIGNKVASGQK